MSDFIIAAIYIGALVPVFIAVVYFGAKYLAERHWDE